jgi:hypothetical protein
MTPIGAADFDPFFHEIVAVEQDDDPEAPVRITGTLWPGLMLGDMLFSRAGVRVRAGARHAEAGIADRSVLHEVFLRRYRATSDLSLGWGTNSQWKTDFRARLPDRDRVPAQRRRRGSQLRAVVRAAAGPAGVVIAGTAGPRRPAGAA